MQLSTKFIFPKEKSSYTNEELCGNGCQKAHYGLSHSRCSSLRFTFYGSKKKSSINPTHNPCILIERVRLKACLNLLLLIIFILIIF